MEQISLYLCKVMIKSNIINKKYVSIYAYGMRNLLIKSLVDVFIILTGVIFRVPLYTVLFYIAFSAVRSDYGGYHANTRWRCFIYTNLIFILNTLFAKYIFDRINSLVLGFLMFVVTFLFYFMNHKEKKIERFISSANIIFGLYVIAVLLEFDVLKKALFSAIISGIFLYMVSYFINYKSKL